MAVRRAAAVVGQIIELRAQFRRPDGSLFDPEELRQVQILDADTDAVLAVVGAADIDRVSEGIYRIYTPSAFAQPRTILDRWFFRRVLADGEDHRTFSTTVAAVAAGGGAGLDILTVEQLKAEYLFGVDLTNDFGEPFPDAVFSKAIENAVAQVEQMLDFDFAPRDWVGDNAERHDYNANDWKQYGHLRLRRHPVRQVVSLELRLPNKTTAEYVFPPEWLNVTIPEAGHLEIVPHSAGLSTFLLRDGGLALNMVRVAGTRWFPGVLRCEYRSGYADASAVPANVRHYMAMQASLNALNLAGDLIAGAGIASKSLSLGGLSQSINTTSSATNAGFGSRIIEYQKEMKEMLPALTAYFHPPRLVIA